MPMVRSAALAVALVFSFSAFGATLTVTSTADVLDGSDGLCTLREAVIAVNTASPSGVVAGECPGGDGLSDEIVLTSASYGLSIGGTQEDLGATGDLDVLQDVVIRGVGTDDTAVRNEADDRVFHIAASAVVTLSDMTIRDGRSSLEPSRRGTGIRNDGDLTVERCLITENIGPQVPGAGIWNGNTLRVYDSSITNNQSGGEGSGGGPDTGRCPRKEG